MSSSSPTSPNAVLRFLRKSFDNPDALGAAGVMRKRSAGDAHPGGGGFRAKFRRPKLTRATTLPVELEVPDDKDSLVVSEDRSARDVGLPNGTRFVESDTISRATSRRTPSVPPSVSAHDHAFFAETVEQVVDFSVASEATSSKDGATTIQRSLARTIQNLLSSVPPFYGAGGTSTPAGGEADPGSSSGAGTDSFLKLLSSASVMNGTWGILDRLVSAPKDNKDSSQGDADSSLMIYGPLIIDAASTVELARSDVVSMSVEVTEEITHPAHEKTWWPFGGHKHGAETAQDSFERRRSVVIQDVTVWHPSLTKVSIKCSWCVPFCTYSLVHADRSPRWGFRL